MSARAALFGKAPRYGDFLVVGMAAERAEAWDAWLSDELQEARQSLGDDWDAAHERAPCWRFLAQIGGGEWAAGALAPSMDAAGRRFMLAVEVTGLDAAAALGGGPALCEAAEALVYAAIAERLPSEALNSGLAALVERADGPEGRLWAALQARTDVAGLWWTTDGGGAPTGLTVSGWPFRGLAAAMFQSDGKEAAA